MVNEQAVSISLSFICFILNIPPLAWHIISKNIPAVTLLVYLEIMMLNQFVGSIIWSGNLTETWNGYVWCDIMIRIQVAVSIGISSCISCISFNLMMIFLTNTATTFWFNNKWVKPTFEIFFSIIFPFIISGVSYFAQGIRFAINENYGCSIGLTNDTISIVVFYLWIFVWCFIGTLISVITLILYFKKRKEAKDILVCTNSGLSLKRFFRLLIYCMLVITAAIIFSCLIGANLKMNHSVFYSKELENSAIKKMILKFPSVRTVDINKWTLIAVSFISFFLFGIGHDANEMYKSFIMKLPFGELILNKFKKINDKIKKVVGEKLINDEENYVLKFWSGDKEDEGSEELGKESNKHSRDYGDNEADYLYSIGKCSATDDCKTANSEFYSIDKFKFEEEEEDKFSPSTLVPGTPNSLEDEVKNYIKNAQGSIDQREGSSKEDVDDEFKYLYY